MEAGLASQIPTAVAVDSGRIIVCGLVLCTSVSVALARPRLRALGGLGPAHAAIIAIIAVLLTGSASLGELGRAYRDLVRPLSAIAGIMVMAAAVRRSGLLTALAARFFTRCGTDAASMFTIVFFFAAATSSVLNNDAMILLLTPVVIGLAQEVWPGIQKLHRVQAYAVFAAIGVAPVVVANPINLLVADQAGIGFNPYLLRMVPLIEQRSRPAADRPVGLSRSQRRTAFILLGVVLAYPVASVFHDWAVAVVSVLGGLLLTLAIRAPLGRVLTREVEWGILLFMLGAFAIGIGLKNAGAVAALSRLYHGGGLLVLAAGSAVGSALLNNHPMTILNLLALESSPISREIHYLVALAGGDIGPRLLPSGSLAGLLWLAACRRAEVQASRSSSATALVHHGGGSHSDSCVDRFSRRAAPAEWMTRHVVCPMILARPSFSTAVLP
jgi:arsenical pump membrane protein